MSADATADGTPVTVAMGPIVALMQQLWARADARTMNAQRELLVSTLGPPCPGQCFLSKNESGELAGLIKNNAQIVE